MKDTIMIQEMVNDYLRKNGKKTVTELMAQKDQREVLGIITPAHKVVLQQMIHQYAKEHGSNINDELGHQQILGVLSNEELKYIDLLLQDYQEQKEEKTKIVA